MKHIEKHVLIAFVILSILFTLGSFGFKYLKNRVDISLEEAEQAEMLNELIEVDPNNLPEGTTFIEPLDKTLKKIIGAKYSKNINDITVTELQSDGIFSRGAYSIANSDVNAIYLAQYANNVWSIVYEGEYEKTPCNVLNSVSYPIALMPDCFNDTTQALEAR